jgi:DNA polymerase
MRGQLHRLADGSGALVTIHPSFLLRIEDETDKASEYQRFVADLRLAKKALAAELAKVHARAS